MTPTTPHNNEALEAFDEILTLLSANQRGIVEFLEQKVRDSLTRANQRAREVGGQRTYDCGCVSCVCNTEDRCLGCGAKSCNDFRGKSCDVPKASEALPTAQGAKLKIKDKLESIQHQCRFNPMGEDMRYKVIELTEQILALTHPREQQRVDEGEVEITVEMATEGARALRDTFSDPNQIARAKAVFKAMTNAEYGLVAAVLSAEAMDRTVPCASEAPPTAQEVEGEEITALEHCDIIEAITRGLGHTGKGQVALSLNEILAALTHPREQQREDEGLDIEAVKSLCGDTLCKIIPHSYSDNTMLNTVDWLHQEGYLKGRQSSGRGEGASDA